MDHRLRMHRPVSVPATPNSHFASIISNPLFIIDAESIVIFAPILQLGWLQRTVPWSQLPVPPLSWYGKDRRKPSAISFPLGSPTLPLNTGKWQNVQSLQAGSALLCSTAKAVISSPATTNVSLFANAIALPALIAAIVGFSPAYPTIAVSTISIGSDWTTWAMASETRPYTLMGRSSNASLQFGIFLLVGDYHHFRHIFTCLINQQIHLIIGGKSIYFKRSGCSLTTSKACVR